MSYQQLPLFNMDSYSKKMSSTSFIDNMSLPIHRWYRFSAGFSAGWVDFLLKNKFAEKKTILDPFVGSGTTLIVADKNGKSSYGVEAHPFVARIAQHKLNWNIDTQRLRLVSSELISNAKKSDLVLPATVPKLLLKSYKHDALENLFKLREAFYGVDEDHLSGHLWLAITAILRSVSHVGTAPWQYILPKKRKASVIDPFVAFKAQIEMMIQDIDYMKSLSLSRSSNLIIGDARKLKEIPDSVIDLVISSPPYANNYDYADATRLELTFWEEVQNWGELHEAVRKYLVTSCSQHASKEKLNIDDLLKSSYLDPIRNEIEDVCSALYIEKDKHGGKKKYYLMIAAYFIDMAQVWESMAKKSKPDADICFVIGDSAPYGVYVPVDNWLIKLAESWGFVYEEFVKIRDRNTRWKNRKHDVPLKEGQLWLKFRG